MTMRRSFSDKFKATEALEALRGDSTAQEIAAKHKIVIERVWRSLKQEAVYLHDLQDGFHAKHVIDERLGFDNVE